VSRLCQERCGRASSDSGEIVAFFPSSILRGHVAVCLPLRRPESCPSRGRERGTMRNSRRSGSLTRGSSRARLGAEQDYGWRLTAKASLHRALRQSISVKRHFSPYFPCLSLGHSLRCFSRALWHSAFCFALRVPFGSGFPNKKSLAQNTRGSGPKNRRDFFFGASSERHAIGAWERGTSRRFAQECPEGNPGKYKQGETPWHATKTKSR
jgi:hypothetical protein